MPRPRLPYLQHERSRHGKMVWYVRLSRSTPRTRIKAAFGTPDFMREYQDAIKGIAAPQKPASGKGTLAWAVSMYQDSAAWAKLSEATRKQRRNILRNVLKTAGAVDVAHITAEVIRNGLDRRKATPAAARNFLETMRGLFKWAVTNKIVETNPTEGVKGERLKSDGFPSWNDDDIAAFEARWPVGTRERVAFDILLWTGLRRGDACMLGRQHTKDGLIRLVTEKTGTRVVIPIAPQLAATLKAGPVGELFLIAGQSGNRRVKEAFGEWFRTACKAAGVEKSAHGLRKAAAIRMAMNGANERELNAIFGWTDGKMASHYTREADRERISINAAEKLARRF